MFENVNSSLFDQANDSGILVELIQHLSFYGDGLKMLTAHCLIKLMIVVFLLS